MGITIKKPSIMRKAEEQVEDAVKQSEKKDNGIVIKKASIIGKESSEEIGSTKQNTIIDEPIDKKDRKINKLSPVNKDNKNDDIEKAIPINTDTADIGTGTQKISIQKDENIEKNIEKTVPVNATDIETGTQKIDVKENNNLDEEDLLDKEMREAEEKMNALKEKMKVARAKKEAKARATKEAEARAKKATEEKAKKAAEEKAKKEVEEKAKKEAEEKAKKEAEEKAKKETEEKATKEAEEKAKKETEEKATKEAEEKANRYKKIEKVEEIEKTKATLVDIPVSELQDKDKTGTQRISAKEKIPISLTPVSNKYGNDKPIVKKAHIVSSGTMKKPVIERYDKDKNKDYAKQVLNPKKGITIKQASIMKKSSPLNLKEDNIYDTVQMESASKPKPPTMTSPVINAPKYSEGITRNKDISINTDSKLIPKMPPPKSLSDTSAMFNMNKTVAASRIKNDQLTHVIERNLISATENDLKEQLHSYIEICDVVSKINWKEPDLVASLQVFIRSLGFDAFSIAIINQSKDKSFKIMNHNNYQNAPDNSILALFENTINESKYIHWNKLMRVIEKQDSQFAYWVKEESIDKFGLVPIHDNFHIYGFIFIASVHDKKKSSIAPELLDILGNHLGNIIGLASSMDLDNLPKDTLAEGRKIQDKLAVLTGYLALLSQSKNLPDDEVKVVTKKCNNALFETIGIVDKLIATSK